MTSFEGQTGAFHAPLIGTSSYRSDLIPKSQPFEIMIHEKSIMSAVPATSVTNACSRPGNLW